MQSRDRQLQQLTMVDLVRRAIYYVSRFWYQPPSFIIVSVFLIVMIMFYRNDYGTIKVASVPYASVSSYKFYLFAFLDVRYTIIDFHVVAHVEGDYNAL